MQITSLVAPGRGTVSRPPVAAPLPNLDSFIPGFHSLVEPPPPGFKLEAIPAGWSLVSGGLVGGIAGGIAGGAGGLGGMLAGAGLGVATGAIEGNLVGRQLDAITKGEGKQTHYGRNLGLLGAAMGGGVGTLAGCLTGTGLGAFFLGVAGAIAGTLDSALLVYDPVLK